MNKICRLILGLVVISLSACAFGTQMKFSDTLLEVPKTQYSLVVATSDQRPNVLSGENTPQWVGVQRSGFGIPYGVHTSSGAPLADEFRDSLLHSFPGARSLTLGASKDPEAQFRQQILKESVQRGILLLVRQWKTDVMTNVNLDFDLVLVVLDKAGKVLAKEVATSHEQLAGSFWNPVGASEKVARERQKKILEELFRRPTVARVLG